MADEKIKITGAGPEWDGEYDFNLDFTTLERRWIKQLSKHTRGTMYDGWLALDDDLFLAFAMIALYQADKVNKAVVAQLAEVFAETRGFTVDVIVGADESRPPAESPSNENPSDDGENASTTSSGDGSSSTSEPTALDQRRTGSPGSPTSSTSASTPSAA